MNKNLWLLALAQGFFLTNNVTFIAINGLVGLSLAPFGWMATLPVMGYVVGGAMSTSLVASTQSRFGRKGSFQIGAVVALLSCLLCAYAAFSRNFWLLCAATLIAGYFSANAQLYRFAAAELAAKGMQEKAVSWVMAGGLIGAVIGPNLAKWAQHAGSVPFVGAYAALTVVALVAMLVVAQVEFPPVPPKQKGGAGGRPLSEIMRQPVFIVSTAAAALTRTARLSFRASSAMRATKPCTGERPTCLAKSRTTASTSSPQISVTSLPRLPPGQDGGSSQRVVPTVPSGGCWRAGPRLRGSKRSISASGTGFPSRSRMRRVKPPSGSGVTS